MCRTLLFRSFDQNCSEVMGIQARIVLFLPELLQLAVRTFWIAFGPLSDPDYDPAPTMIMSNFLHPF